ncbi:hypothetical protein OAA18_00305 [bacterium]|jgi:hypothetical protein|nr:hypothetical protein [bacterium]
MGLKDQLTINGSNLTPYNGATPSNMPGVNPQSRLHYEYSINGNPNMAMKPSPSQLDLNGLTPPKYTDNLPG